jgi:predicted transcriptional regulator
VIEGLKATKGSKHGFAVIRDPSHLEGIVTEWDILSKVVAVGLDLEKVTIREIMTRELISVDAETGISTVSQTMTEKGVRRHLVRQGGTVIGVRHVEDGPGTVQRLRGQGPVSDKPASGALVLSYNRRQFEFLLSETK